jgi:hypothetical protein
MKKVQVPIQPNVTNVALAKHQNQGVQNALNVMQVKQEQVRMVNVSRVLRANIVTHRWVLRIVFTVLQGHGQIVEVRNVNRAKQASSVTFLVKSVKYVVEDSIATVEQLPQNVTNVTLAKHQNQGVQNANCAKQASTPTLLAKIVSFATQVGIERAATKMPPVVSNVR